MVLPSLARGAPRARLFSASATFELETKFETHLCDSPAQETVATKDELMTYFRKMYTVRRMEITCDTEYKARLIRGFCHLYDGQEAVAEGIVAGLDSEDDIIQAYRCHGFQYSRGDTVRAILAELYGFKEGSTKGKGGSMHFYSKENKFWGGSGIVGAQIPLGAGLAFANKYKHKGKEGPMPVSITLFGDGASNQGQGYEAANMAKLWGLPCIFAIENNEYGMGTSKERSTADTDYYKHGGNTIPGLKVDGMDVLAVREAMRWAKDFCGNGNGPLFIEFNTYRYHGHSMSDPGISYRDRDEVSGVRASRDPIEQVKKRMVDAGFATAKELKAIEKEVRAFVSNEAAEAKKGSFPDAKELFTEVYSDDAGNPVMPPYIRHVEYENSIFSN